MQVRMIQSQQGPKTSRAVGDIVDVTVKEGKRLIDADIARPVSLAKKRKQPAQQRATKKENTSKRSASEKATK